MEAIAALSLACNVMQVISFCHEAISVANKLRKEKSADPELTTHAERLKKMGVELRRAVDAKTPSPISASDKELRDMAIDLARISDELGTELAKYTGGKRCKTIRYMWRRKKVDEMKKSLGRAQKVMQTRISVNLCQQLEHMSAETVRKFTELDTKNKIFYDQLMQSNRDVSRLVPDVGTTVQTHVTDQAQELRMHITSEAMQTRQNTSAGFQRFQSDSDRERKVEKLINSLRFPEMNERYNSVAVNHQSTFEWLFEGSENPRIKWDSFITWLKSEDDIYWISGKPGSGKNTLMKFLVSDSRTAENLREWKPNVSLAWAFIWSAGSPMQRNLKGLLCTLLMQILSGCEGVAAELLRNNSATSKKLSPHDWSNRELENTLKDAITTPERPMCVFIDGLDEIDRKRPDEILDLLSLIGSLGSLPGIKLCVSSRPEPILKRQMEKFPLLKLQDLTDSDIRKYAKECLYETIGHSGEHVDQDTQLSSLVYTITRKAEGVFLWVALVVKNVIWEVRGAKQFEKLESWIEGLDGNLESLYSDMWDRANRGNRFHRQQSALYLHLALKWLEVSSLYRLQGGLVFNNFHIVMTLNEPVRKRVIQQCGTPTQESFEELQKLCQETLNSTMARTVGFLEARNKLANPSIEGLHFIHRSVRDFLTDTPKGHEILSYYSWLDSELEIPIMEIYLAEDLCVPFFLGAKRFPKSSSVSKVYLTRLSWSNREVREAGCLLIKQALDTSPEWERTTHTLTACAAQAGLSELVEHSLATKSPPSQMTMVEWRTFLLRCVLRRCSWQSDYYCNYGLVWWLLNQGVDPNHVGDQPGTLTNLFVDILLNLQDSVLSPCNMIKIVQAFLQQGLDSDRLCIVMVNQDVGPKGSMKLLGKRSMNPLGYHRVFSWGSIPKSKWPPRDEYAALYEMSISQLAMLLLPTVWYRPSWDTPGKSPSHYIDDDAQRLLDWKKLWTQCPGIFPSERVALPRITHLVNYNDIVIQDTKFLKLENKAHNANIVLPATLFDPDYNPVLRPGDGNYPTPRGLTGAYLEHFENSGQLNKENVYHFLKEHIVDGTCEEDQRDMLEWLIEHKHLPGSVLDNCTSGFPLFERIENHIWDWISK